MTETPRTPAVRRAARAASTVAALAVIATTLLLSGPAHAVPEGWSNPEDVDPLQALLLLGGVPLLLFLLITLAVYLPSFARSGSSPERGGANEWIGGPRHGVDQLAAPDSEESKAGGASGRW